MKVKVKKLIKLKKLTEIKLFFKVWKLKEIQ